MVILGVDPGTLCTGYGIIKFDGSELARVKSGIINLPKDEQLSSRLGTIYNELDRLIKIYKPGEFAIETAFYGKNVQSAMKIGYARGVSLLCAVHNKMPGNEYSPREVKKSVVGNGAASKEQVQYMVKKLLGLGVNEMKLDESDALAVAICHAFKLNSPVRKNGNWKSFVKNNPERIVQ